MGLFECSKKGIREIEIEGDSTIVINAIKSRSTSNWHLKALLEQILFILSDFDNYSVRYIYREANSEADFISKLAVEGSELRWWAKESSLTS